MRAQLFSSILLLCTFVFSQDNVITITDYRKLLVAVNASGEMVPVTAGQDVRQAGFFLTEPDDGFIRICPGKNQISIWVNGQLLEQLDSCKIYEPELFFSFGAKDTLYLSFSTPLQLEGFSADLIRFREQQVIREDPAISRASYSSFGDFVVTSLLIILVFYGVSIKSFPARVKYIVEKAFSLKESTYEFVNTSFLSGASLYLILLLSFVLGFCGVYFEAILEAGWQSSEVSLIQYLRSWLKYFFWMLAFIAVKWIVILVISRLFRFRAISDYQLFDFLNFSTLLVIPLFLFCLLDYTLNSPVDSWVSLGVVKVFAVILIVAVFWFTLKFVSISSSKKLSIISYLCATEFLPALTLLVWFYK